MAHYTSGKPDGYIPRLVDDKLERYLTLFGGVEVRGTRWSGKSWTSQAFGNTVNRVDLNPELYRADPELALLGESPVVIDEWQDAPAIWNHARHSIDEQAGNRGRYILTGSSTPPDDEDRHSGAGRIGRIAMRTMSLAETGESQKSVSLAGLFRGEFQSAKSDMGLAELSEIICRGGWPSLQCDPTYDAQEVIASYLDALFDVSMPKAGKSPALARRIAASLARNVATSAKLATIALDAAKDGSAPDEDTVSSYLDEFSRNYFSEELPGWDAPVRAKSRLRTKPKRYFADPSVAASLLNVDAARLRDDQQLFGLLFESLCIHDLSVYAEVMPDAGSSPLRYYSDADGLEVDAVIELRDGRWAGIEVKLGENKVDEAVRNLNRLRKKVAANPAARNPAPTFMAVLLGKGEFARYIESEDVYVIPIDCLGA